EAICLKCLEKKPSQRYRSARALADDLERWLQAQTPREIPGVVVRTARVLRRRAAAVLLVTGVLGAFTAAYLLDPKRPLRQTRSELGAGRPVTVIGRTGEPEWYQWLAGKAVSQASLAADGVFTISTWNHALLEIVPDPQCNNYRLSLGVRHE